MDSLSQNPLWNHSSDGAKYHPSKFPLFDEKGHKRCPKCTEYKPLKHFHIDNTSKHGVRAICKRCTNASIRKQYKQGKIYTAEKQAYYRKRNYGIDDMTYQAMFEAQGGLCAICHQPEIAKKGTLSVDHSHVTGEIRGLLCYKCNSALGGLDDDIERVRNLLLYLEKWL
jgi:hypothetical protein